MSVRDEYDPTISSTVKLRLETLERQLDEALERIRILEDQARTNQARRRHKLVKA